ncbi:MAG TPA: lysophospholipid acyltransferase family protein [Candidatus Sulfotelmatobacter sp.]|jgi:1-acyl-sn-glycerol-3-phosphate acyltransferase|nr:lysophospholipid acyltransferase family protein [Candidatus Sulfotelmatobacter sp.]
MKRAWFVVRSALLWAVSLLNFSISVPILVVLAFVLNPRRHDWLQRAFCRRIVFFAGARVKLVASPGFDPTKTCFFISNHVNLFDPFVLYCVIPQFTRGWELESHFRIPIYGMLMKRFGNVPVPDVRRASDLKRLWRLTKDAIDGGMSLIVFPEGKRTRDGRVGEFELGAFRLAQQLAVPLVPVSIVGSFQHHATGNWMFWPAEITVHLHDTMNLSNLSKEDVPALRDRVHALISAPVDAFLDEIANQNEEATEETATG